MVSAQRPTFVHAIVAGKSGRLHSFTDMQIHEIGPVQHVIEQLA